MATKRTIDCPSCGPSPSKGTLFSLLLRLSDDGPQSRRCGDCGCGATLRLKFAFGLDATDTESSIEAVFRPRRPESWLTKGKAHVTFYPFLVVLKRANRKRAVWLPYWHHVRERGGRHVVAKYGQWAPSMDERLFANLLSQARVAGFLNIKRKKWR